MVRPQQAWCSYAFIFAMENSTEQHSQGTKLKTVAVRSQPWRHQENSTSLWGKETFLKSLL